MKAARPDGKPPRQPLIAGERVVLSPLALADAPRLFEYRSHPDVRRYQGFGPASVQDAVAFIEGCLTGVSGWHQLGIRLKDGGELAGDVGFRLVDDERPQAEIGVTLAAERQGRGLATEALSLLLGHLFDDLDVHRAFASVDPRNTASIALLRRLGMRQEAYFRESLWSKGTWTDDVVFAMLRAEWAAGGPVMRGDGAMPEDEARETWEYLRLCGERSLMVYKFPATGWMVGRTGSRRPGGHGATLQAAYEDYLAREDSGQEGAGHGRSR